MGIPLLSVYDIIDGNDAMNNYKILSSEYGAFREEIQDVFKRLLVKPSVILDPMSGTAPLIAFIETKGHTAYFNDILPVHFFVNKAMPSKMIFFLSMRP